jgi:hypothetical protein
MKTITIVADASRSAPGWKIRRSVLARDDGALVKAWSNEDVGESS